MRTELKRNLCLAMAVFGLTAGSAQAEIATVWSTDFSSEKVRDLNPSAKIVATPAPATGKLLMLSNAGGRTPAWCSAKELRLAGPVTVAVRLRGKGFAGVGPVLNFNGYFRVGKNYRGVEIPGTVYGTQLDETKAMTISFNILLAPQLETYSFEISGQWALKETNANQVIWIERIEILANGPAASFISRVEPDKTSYRLGQTAKVAVTVVNPTATPFKGSLTLTELFDLEEKTDAATGAVELAPGATKEFNFSWKAKLPEAGRELRVTLLDAGKKVLDTYTDFYGIAKDPSYLNTMAGGVIAPVWNNLYNCSYVGPASYAQTLGFIQFNKAMRLQRFEYFSWSYNELAQFMPPKDEEPYLGNEGIWWQSFKKFKNQVGLLKAIGVTPISYVNGGLWGPEAYKLYQKHPEWFLAVGSFDMEWRAKYERRNEFEFMQEKTPFFYCYFNPVLPEARRYVADQFIGIAKEMGFEGARWDVWNMSVSPGQKDMFGKEVAKTAEEADRLTAESLAAVKALVAREIPEFTWGYNYGGPEEVEKTPLTIAEKCRGGGWILDEIICTYQEKTSPFHYWDAYRDRIVGWGDHIRQLGGIYNPFPFRRGGALYTVDHLYEGIFRLIGGARSYMPGEFNAGAAGKQGLMAFRYSDVFFGWSLRLQPATQTLVKVTAPDTLWWKSMVLRGAGANGRPRAIVHLVNSPPVNEVEENPQSLVRPPVKDVVVNCGPQDGKKLPVKAWVISAEPATPDAEPAVTATVLPLTRHGNTAQVTVPWVLYWKTVVFEY